jgi:hypothetical protein
MSKQGDSSYCFFRSLDSQDRFLPRPSCLLDCNQGVGKWQLKIPFPARKFVFLFPPQNLINLSEVLSFCKFVLFLSVSSLCLFPTFFFTFPIFAAIFFFVLRNFCYFSSSTHFPPTFPLQSLFDRLENGLATSVSSLGIWSKVWSCH